MNEKSSKAIAAAIACLLAIAVGATAGADAAGAAGYRAAEVAPRCSLPYVDDADILKGGRLLLVVRAAGSGRLECRAEQGGKRLKVTRHGKRLWSTVAPSKRRPVKVSVRARGGKWRSIAIRIY